MLNDVLLELPKCFSSIETVKLELASALAAASPKGGIDFVSFMGHVNCVATELSVTTLDHLLKISGRMELVGQRERLKSFLVFC